VIKRIRASYWSNGLTDGSTSEGTWGTIFAGCHHSQVPHFVGLSSLTYIFVAITLLIVYVLPRFFKAIPAPLVAIVVLTAAAVGGNLGWLSWIK